MNTVRAILIIAVYYEAVNSQTQLEFSDTPETFTRELVYRTVSILCRLRPNLAHVYYDSDLKTSIAEKLIFLMNNCTSLMLVRSVLVAVNT